MYDPNTRAQVNKPALCALPAGCWVMNILTPHICLQPCRALDWTQLMLLAKAAARKARQSDLRRPPSAESTLMYVTSKTKEYNIGRSFESL